VTTPSLSIRVHAGGLAVARLAPGVAPPSWAAEPAPPLHVVLSSADETSIVTAADRVPPDVRAERGFRALEVAGPLDFALTGILARLTATLATAGVPVFAVSSFDTDWLLVREPRLAEAVAALARAGVRITGASVVGD